MNTWSKHLDDYLRLRRQLGFKLAKAERYLRQFLCYANQEGTGALTTKLALQWATQPKGVQPNLWALRLGVVRQFAVYLSAIEPRTEVPPQKLLPFPLRRRSPHLHRDEDVRKLMEAAEGIHSLKGLTGPTLSVLFGLLVATGIRIGEALKLDREDVDLRRGLLTIWRSKGNKSRFVPLHRSTAKALRQYAAVRDQRCPQPESPAFFVFEEGQRPTRSSVHRWYMILSRQLGLRGPSERQGPRLHDLRHRFAIQTLLRWYRSKVDVETHLPELATYLGHGHVHGTYWYLSATPELLQLATRRLRQIKGVW